MSEQPMIMDDGTHTAEDASASAGGTYAMSREGRRQAIVLLLGVISIAVFALWSLINIVGDGISDIEWVTGALMLAILLVSPLVAWALLEEAYAAVVADSSGLTYSTFGGVSLRYNWSDIKGVQRKNGKSKIARFFLGDDDAPKQEVIAASSSQEIDNPDGDIETNDAENSAEAPGTLLLSVSTDPTLQIKNPLVRFLHKQAYGVSLPIHGGLTNRDLLINNINKHTGSNTEVPDSKLRIEN